MGSSSDTGIPLGQKKQVLRGMSVFEIATFGIITKAVVKRPRIRVNLADMANLQGVKRRFVLSLAATSKVATRTTDNQRSDPPRSSMPVYQERVTHSEDVGILKS